MNIPSEIESTIKATVNPWMTVAILVGMLIFGCLGIFVGYEYASGQAAKDREQLNAAYSDAMRERELRRADAEARGHKIETDFLLGLSDIKVVNKTYHTQVKTETEKLVYTDCKLPDSGVDLITKHIDAVNLRLIGKVK